MGRKKTRDKQKDIVRRNVSDVKRKKGEVFIRRK